MPEDLWFVLPKRDFFLSALLLLAAPLYGAINSTSHNKGSHPVNATLFVGALAVIKGGFGDRGNAVNNTGMLNVPDFPVSKTKTKIRKRVLLRNHIRKGYRSRCVRRKNKFACYFNSGKGVSDLYLHPFFRYPICRNKTSTKKTVLTKRNKRSVESSLMGRVEFYLYVYRRFENGSFIDEDFTHKNNSEVLDDIRTRPVYLCKAKLNINRIGFTEKNIEKIEIIAYGKRKSRGLIWQKWNETANADGLLKEYQEKIRGKNPVLMVEGCCIGFEQEVQLMGFTARHNQNVATKDGAQPLFLAGVVWPTTRYYRKDDSYDDDIKAFRQDNIIADNAAEPMREIFDTVVRDAKNGNETSPELNVIAHSRGGANIIAMLRKGDLPEKPLSSLNLVSSDLSEQYFQLDGKPLFTDIKGDLQRWGCRQRNTTQGLDCASSGLHKIAKSISVFYSPEDAAFSEPQKLPAFIAWYYGVSDLINKTSDAIGGKPFSKPGAQPDFVSDRNLAAMGSALSPEAIEGQAWDKAFSGGHGNMYWNEGFNELLFRKIRSESPAALMDFCYQVARNSTQHSESTSIYYITQRLPMMADDRVYGFYDGSVSRSAYDDDTGRNVSALGWGMGVAATVEAYFPVTGVEEPCAVHFRSYQKNNTKEELAMHLKLQMKESPHNKGLLLYIGGDEPVSRSLQLGVIYKRLGGNVTTLLYAPPGSGVRDKTGFVSTNALASASKMQTAAVLEMALQAVKEQGEGAKLYIVSKGTGGYFLKSGLDYLFNKPGASSFLRGGLLKSVILPASLLTEGEMEGKKKKSLYSLIKKLLSAEGKILIPHGNYYLDWDNSNQVANRIFQCDNPATHYGVDLCYSSDLDVLSGRCRYSNYPVSTYFENQKCISHTRVKPLLLTAPKRVDDIDGDLRELYDQQYLNEVSYYLEPPENALPNIEVPIAISGLNATVSPTVSAPAGEQAKVNDTAHFDAGEMTESVTRHNLSATADPDSFYTLSPPVSGGQKSNNTSRITVSITAADNEKLSTALTPTEAELSQPEEWVTEKGEKQEFAEKLTDENSRSALRGASIAGSVVLLAAVVAGCYYCRDTITKYFCLNCRSAFCERCHKRCSECCIPGIPADRNTVLFRMRSSCSVVGRRLAESDALVEGTVAEKARTPEEVDMFKETLL